MEPRRLRYISTEFDFGNLDAVAKHFEVLEHRLANASDRPAFEAWLDEWDETQAAWDECETQASLAWGLRMSDKEAERRMRDVTERLRPFFQEHASSLWARLVVHPGWERVSSERAASFRQAEAEARLASKERPKLYAQEQAAVRDYREIIGGLRFQFEGRAVERAELSKLLGGADREIRRRAWEAVSCGWEQAGEKIDAVFARLRELRRELARAAGFSGYPEYRFFEYQRRDYGPAECLAFHREAERVLPPVLERIRETTRAALGVERLRPWDQLVVPQSAADTEQVFADEAELVKKASRMFRRCDARAAGIFDEMAGHGLLDLMPRPAKEGGAYQAASLASCRPFVGMSATGSMEDIGTLAHECGHAFHVVACRGQSPMGYARVPVEFREFAAIGMEWLVISALDEFFDAGRLRLARRRMIERALNLFAAVAASDAWQFAAYGDEVKDGVERDAQWSGLVRRFFGETAHDSEFEQTQWRRQTLFFEAPFYYIEYAIAQLAALELAERARVDPRGAWERYWAALELGDARPLPDLFRAAGVGWDFSPGRLERVVQALAKEWDALSVD
jgi:oligoendopeptidase F